MFEQYTVSCNNPACYAHLRLPSDQLFVPGSCDPETFDLPDETFWPPDEWRANIACPRCKQVREYDAEDVGIGYSERLEKQPKCLLVSMGCARPQCKVAFRFFIVPVDEEIWRCRASAEDIDLDGDIVSLLRNGWIDGKCPRGHGFGMLPKELYKVTVHSGTIPSQHEDLHWVQHSSRLIGVATGTPVRRRSQNVRLRQRGDGDFRDGR